MSEPRLVFTPAELQQVLGVGKGTALRLANSLGVRISPRRIVVPRVRLEAWLEGVNSNGNDTPPRSEETEAARD
jgi:hypothetical protein